MHTTRKSTNDSDCITSRSPRRADEKQLDTTSVIQTQARSRQQRFVGWR